MTREPRWPADLTRLTGRQIRDRRERRGLSAEKLANEMSDVLGSNYTRTQVTNLESGRRETITIGELLAFAKVLDVPPLLLVFPLQAPHEFEVLPGVVDDAWTAYRWFIGESPTAVLGQGRDPSVQYFRGDDDGRLVDIYRQHHAALHGFLRYRAGRSEDERRQSSSLTSLAAARIKMHQQGWPLPPLPADVLPDLEAPLLAWGYRADGESLVELVPGERDITAMEDK